MPKRSGLLSRVYIASPCPASWANMEGNDQVRHYKQCNLNVYNISEMSSTAAEKLIVEKEGKLCIRMYQRADGTIITQDCPVALRWLKRKLRIACVFASCLFSWFSSFCRAEAQELRINLNDLPYQTGMGANILIGAGGIGMSPPIIKPSKELNDQLPFISPYTENGVTVTRYWPPRLVLREKNDPSYIPNTTILPMPATPLIKLSKLESYNSSVGAKSTKNTQFLPFNATSSSQPSVTEAENQCIDESTDIFVLLRKKQRHANSFAD